MATSIAPKPEKKNVHHVQQTWFKRLRDKHTPVTVQLMNTPIPLVSVVLVDWDQFTMTFRETFAESVSLHVLFKHGIVGLKVFGNDIATTTADVG